MNRATQRIAFFLALLLAATLAGSARAEDAGDGHALLEMPRARQGYWIGLGISGVASKLIEEGRNRGIYGGRAYTLRIGELVTERFGLGLLVEFGAIKKGTDQGGLGGLTLEGSYTLWRNLSAHTGFGVGFVDVSDKQAIDTTLRGGAGAYFLLGTSYDFFPWRKRFSGGWAITPTVDFRVMPDGNIHTYTMFAGIQIIRWSGLPQNMLVLPEE